MKKHVSFEELNQLSESQKDSLRDLWKPEKYELFIVPICQDVENDLYDYDIYLLQDILVNPINEDKRYTISNNPIHTYDYHEIIFEAIPLKQTNFNNYDVEDGDSAGVEEATNEAEEENEATYSINKSYCLPLLDISKMIEIFYEEKCLTQLSLQLNQDTQLQMCNIDGLDYEGDCLCDVLWEAFKKIL